ncbi:MAG TPA: IPT/TIG domain-containing protein [Bryobacteraceae bacterium]|nr:IPT/TIG domain-containing protein [Bryobacteraceae bacterium]
MKTSSLVCGLLIASGSLFAQQYTMTTVGGTGVAGWYGDTGPALSAQFYHPIRVALDSAGDIYLNDLGNSSVRIISPDGVVNSITGNGSPGYSGDGGSAIGAQLSSPHDIALDSNNNLYIADTGNHRIRMVSGGKISTFAGTGASGPQNDPLGDGGPAINAQFITPTGVAVDRAGNVYVSDIGNATVRKITPDGIITRFAGTGFLSFGAYEGEGGPATQALLGVPYSLTTDNAGNLYIVDTGLSRLFRIGPDGNIHTVRENFSAQNCAIDPAGNIYAADPDQNTVDKITTNGTLLWIGGDGISAYAGDGSVATSGSMSQPYGVAVDANGNILVAESGNAIIRKLAPVPFSIGAISNAATIQPFVAPAIGSGDATVPISPGEIIVLFGTGLGPATLVSNTLGPDGKFGTSLAGTTVSIGGVNAPIIYTSSTLVSAVVPYAVDGLTSANVYVTYQGNQSVVNTVQVAPTAPGLFTLDASGAGNALAVNFSNGQLNTGVNPASVGDFLILYATGEGQTTPGGVDGQLAPSNAPIPVHSVTATVNGIPASVTYAGGAPGIVAGVMQVNLQIPSGVPSGAATLKLLINNVYSPGVTIYVQ